MGAWHLTDRPRLLLLPVFAAHCAEGPTSERVTAREIESESDNP
jgi:hypothetical protein